MKMNMEALKSLELKLAEFSKSNGAIAEHKSANANCNYGTCYGTCYGCHGSCDGSCSGSCKNNK